MKVLLQPAIAHLGKAEHPLDDPDRMFHPRPHFRLCTVFRPLDLIDNTAMAIASIGEIPAYYPPNDEAQKAKAASEVQSQTKEAERRHNAFVRSRLAAIILSFLSLIVFVAGNVVGGWAVLHAQLKPASSSAVIAPPCKDGSQSCQPWERDWGHTNLQPGTTVTKEVLSLPPRPSPEFSRNRSYPAF
jgi:hypothetical protein